MPVNDNGSYELEVGRLLLQHRKIEKIQIFCKTGYNQRILNKLYPPV